MKKLSLLSIIFLSVLFSNAQTEGTRNPGFENWGLQGSYYDPAQWWTLNFLYDVGFDTTTMRTTDAHSGTYAARLVSKSGPFQDIPGLLASGQVVDVNGNPTFERMRIPFSSRPSKIRFWYKSYPSPGDECGMYMFLSKWNSVLQRTDTIAFVGWGKTDTADVYTLAELTVNYYSSQNPDSASILFASSRDGFAPFPGSTFIIDDFEMVYDHTSINETNTLISADIYPNPASSVVRISASVPVTTQLYDLNGRLLQSSANKSAEHTMELHSLQPGVYFIHLVNEDGAKSVKKLIRY